MPIRWGDATFELSRRAIAGKSRLCGIHGNRGIVESVTYRFQRVLAGSNPTLSANKLF